MLRCRTNRHTSSRCGTGSHISAHARRCPSTPTLLSHWHRLRRVSSPLRGRRSCSPRALGGPMHSARARSPLPLRAAAHRSACPCSQPFLALRGFLRSAAIGSNPRQPRSTLPSTGVATGSSFASLVQTASRCPRRTSSPLSSACQLHHQRLRRGPSELSPRGGATSGLRRAACCWSTSRAI